MPPALREEYHYTSAIRTNLGCFKICIYLPYLCLRLSPNLIVIIKSNMKSDRRLAWPDPRPPGRSISQRVYRETEVAAGRIEESEGSIIPLKGLPFCLSLFHLASKTASADFPNTISNSSAVNFISVFGFLIASTHSASGVNTFGLGKPLPNITL